jgi:hypothetical protein
LSFEYLVFLSLSPRCPKYPQSGYDTTFPIKAMYKGVSPIDSDNNNPKDGAISLKANSTMPLTKRSYVVHLDFWLYPIPNDIKNNIIDGMPINNPRC